MQSGSFRKLGKRRQEGTGFIIKGSELFPPWGDDPIFVTASFIVCSKKSFKSCVHGPEAVQASFPGLEADAPPIRFGVVLWERRIGSPSSEEVSDDHGVTILRINGPLPFGARLIDKVRRQEFENLPNYNSGKPANERPSAFLARPLATLGLGVGRPFEEEGAGFAALSQHASRCDE